MKHGWRSPVVILGALALVVAIIALGRDILGFELGSSGSDAAASGSAPQVQGALLDTPASFVASEMLTFQQRQGRPEWVESQQQKVRDLQIRFNTGGSVEYTTSDVRTDIYPVVGRFADSGGRVGFTATNSATNDIGVSFVTIVGELERIDGRLVLTLSVTAGAGTAAEINDIPLGSTSSASYDATVVLVPA